MLSIINCQVTELVEKIDSDQFLGKKSKDILNLINNISAFNHRKSIVDMNIIRKNDIKFTNTSKVIKFIYDKVNLKITSKQCNGYIHASDKVKEKYVFS